jgi:hypothetical protein
VVPGLVYDDLPAWCVGRVLLLQGGEPQRSLRVALVTAAGPPW